MDGFPNIHLGLRGCFDSSALSFEATFAFAVLEMSERSQVEGGLIVYVKSKPLGNGQIISIDVLVVVMIIAVFHKKLI